MWKITINNINVRISNKKCVHKIDYNINVLFTLFESSKFYLFYLFYCIYIGDS